MGRNSVASVKNLYNLDDGYLQVFGVFILDFILSNIKTPLKFIEKGGRRFLPYSKGIGDSFANSHELIKRS